MFFAAMALTVSDTLFASGRTVSGRVMERNIPDGPRLVMEPRRGSGMVCLSVVVSAGSALEEPSMRGISHFMEHMAFDGSERYSRQQINGWADETGSFLNAFTREEYTVYFTLIPTSELEDGFDILSQMLLHSVIPQKEIEKEKKVITEEMHKDEDNLNALRDEIVKRHLYVGSPLAESIIGTQATVLSFSREDLLDYYRRAYDPRTMMVYLLGDFDESDAEALTAAYFTVPSSQTGLESEEEDEEESHGGNAPFEGGAAGAAPPFYRNRIVNVEKEGIDEGLDVLVSLPVAGSKDLAAAIVLPELLNRPDGPLDAVKKDLTMEEASADVEFHRNFSALRFHF
ncbi:MAG: hypothetical protein B6D63_01950, partial [Candidatus Latescibacteria bacterium 4484_7]